MHWGKEVMRGWPGKLILSRWPKTRRPGKSVGRRSIVRAALNKLSGVDDRRHFALERLASLSP
jgi:hypothetical protein